MISGQLATGSAAMLAQPRPTVLKFNDSKRPGRTGLPSNSLAACDENDERAERVRLVSLSPADLSYEPLPDELLKLNVGGCRYVLRAASILKQTGETFLCRFVRVRHELRVKLADGYLADSEEYFFERVPRHFEPIYEFYSAGSLHVPKDVCFDKFMEELHYWSISRDHLSPCCSPFDSIDDPLDKDEEAALLGEGPRRGDGFDNLVFGSTRRKLWVVLEGLAPSIWWKMFEVTSITFVAISIIALILASMPEFQVSEEKNDLTGGHRNVSGGSDERSETTTENEEGDNELAEAPTFRYIEYVCVAYFAFEYLLRWLVSPYKIRFMLKWLNIIDLVAILPFFLELFLAFVGITDKNVRKVRWALLTIRILRVLRMVRIAKLARFSPGLHNFILTLKRSRTHMQMVGVVMFTVVIFFSTLVYFCEKDTQQVHFRSIPASFWWCIVTMTTVGYGDVVPVTTFGKIFGSGAIVCGVMVLALPITIMVNNFMQVVKLKEEKIIKKYQDANPNENHVDGLFGGGAV